MCYIMSKEGERGTRMEAKTRRLLKILTGVIAALLFGVFILSFSTFSENDKTEEYVKFRSIVAANVSVGQKSSSGFYVFSRRESAETTEEESGDSESDGETSESSGATSSEAESGSQSSSSSSSSSVSPSRSSSSSSSSSSASSGSADAVSASSDSSASSSDETDGTVPILGAAVLTKSQLLAYSAPYAVNMRLTCSVDELIGYYLSVGAKYGVRGDIAYLQAIIETGWFKYNRPKGYYIYENGGWTYKNDLRPEGYYVVPSDNNFCGLGVTGYVSENNTLCRFDTAALGVEAHIQHLYAYACKSALPAAKVDPRFGLVTRGCAPNWNDLGGGNWAADPEYSVKILSSYNKVLANY